MDACKSISGQQPYLGNQLSLPYISLVTRNTQTPPPMYQPYPYCLMKKLWGHLTTFCTKFSLHPNWYQLCWLGITHQDSSNAHTPIFHPIYQPTNNQMETTVLWTNIKTMDLLPSNHPPRSNPYPHYNACIVLTYVLEIWNKDNN